MNLTKNTYTLTAISGDQLLHGLLATSDTPRTLGNVVTEYYRRYFDATERKSALKKLIDDGYAEEVQAQKRGQIKRLKITAAGRAALPDQFGFDKLDQKLLTTRVWPALALGINPRSPEGARLAKYPLWVTLAVLYKFPVETIKTASAKQVAQMLLIKGLSGKLQLPELPEDLKIVAQNLIALNKPEKLRIALLQLALQLSLISQTETQETVIEPIEKSNLNNSESLDIREFAGRVQGLTDQLITPPLSRAVAIAQVYDAYKSAYSDAITLDDFKKRLLEAHVKRYLVIRSLDQPDALPKELIERSAIRGTWDTFHLIVRSEAL